MRFWCGIRAGLAAAGVGLLMVAGVGHAQQQGQKSCAVVDENGKTVIWPDCKPPADDATPATPAESKPVPPVPDASGSQGTGSDGSNVPASKRFPYPGEQSTGTQAIPAAGSSAGDGSSLPASKRFPYPGEPVAGGTDAAAGGDTKPTPAGVSGGGGLQDAGSSGSSSSGASSSSSTNDSSGDAGPLAGDDDAAAKSAAARKEARHKLPPVPRQSADEREVEDLKVASFYMDDKNFKGAYARAADAVSIAGDDAEAHLALAEAARRLGKLDEAMAHYKKVLTLDPVPKTKRAAEKALKEMSGG